MFKHVDKIIADQVTKIRLCDRALPYFIWPLILLPSFYHLQAINRHNKGIYLNYGFYLVNGESHMH